MKSKRPQNLAIDAVFDLETTNWTEFVVGGFFDGRKFLFDSNEDRFFDLLLGFSGTIWAHNGGFFDFLWVVSMCLEREISFQPTMQGSRILILKVGKTTFIDSMGLIPFSLRKAGTICGTEKGDFDYELITHHMEAGLFREMVDYLEQDCMVLWDVLNFLAKYAKENNIILRTTIGSTAYHSASSELEIVPEKWNNFEWKFSRAGYYGGRCEVFKTSSEFGFRVDRNSSYSAALVETPVPIGRRRMIAGKDCSKAFDARYGGIYQASLSVPISLYYPPLPVRAGKRLTFPVGNIGGVWALPELEKAIEMGCTVNRITAALIWESTDIVMGPWCERVWELRKTANDGLNRWLKYLLNSMTGKLGEKMQKSIMKPRAAFKHKPKPCPGSKGKCSCTDEKCTGGCGSWRPVDPLGLLWTRPTWRIPPNSRPHWAAYLTCSARLSLLERLRSTAENGVYCDTDSVYGEGKICGKVGENLGEWKHEGNYTNWRCVAPKLYSFDDPETHKSTVKGKGFPGLTKDGFDELLEGKKVDCGERPQSFISGFKKGRVWCNRSVIKQIHPKEGWVGNRKLDGNTTFPTTVREITKR